MRLRVLYDNRAMESFKGDWGFSCLIGDEVLFDTGANLNILLHNINHLEVDIKNIHTLALSHNHRDHAGGIGILEKLGEIKVYLPSSFSRSLKKNIASFGNTEIVEISESQKIADRIYTTGELGRETKEQSLVVHGDDEWTLVTGCAHPGLETILEKAEEFGKIHCVIGGFHDFSRLYALEHIPLIIPCHCTSKKKEIHELYKLSSKHCGAGLDIEV